VHPRDGWESTFPGRPSLRRTMGFRWALAKHFSFRLTLFCRAVSRDRGSTVLTLKSRGRVSPRGPVAGGFFFLALPGCVCRWKRLSVLGRLPVPAVRFTSSSLSHLVTFHISPHQRKTFFRVAGGGTRVRGMERPWCARVRPTSGCLGRPWHTVLDETACRTLPTPWSLPSPDFPFGPSLPRQKEKVVWFACPPVAHCSKYHPSTGPVIFSFVL